ncbi:hypothetical protein RchiOBHm_Chr6g0291061 [Rosa chinensis]|uniref:Uncharacterized protein n=1 Tax=Rosa chinensis TaxID=74649 RepID=A0A2P6PW34_ROSCH|nr:uncharacterized protein LOC112168861 [Rosa chinensis]PRQ26116.1 hypothetical protein RchiOBHm_Chr6g0291061 [Rosa chinensis]
MAQTPRSTNLKTERVQSQPERPNLPTEEMAPENAPPQKKSKARKKRPRYYTAVRRSSRIRNTVTPSQNRSLQPVQITISESESESDREEEPPCLEENVEELAVRGEKTLDEKVDYAVQLLETMSSQGNNRISGTSELRYRSLYFESQKQNENLKKENRELSLKLQVALAKIEGFEKGSNASVEWMAKFKDVLLVTSLAKASEMVASQDPKAASSSKRKRHP